MRGLVSPLTPLSYPSELGDKAPEFNGLLGVDGRRYSTSTFENRSILLLIFMANRCPTARVYTDRMNAIQDYYGGRGLQLVAINSDSPYLFSSESHSEMVRIARERGFRFPYLKDEDQEVARSYGALVTLHAFLLDEERRIRYRGRIDDSRDPSLVRSNDLRNAVDDVLAEREVRVPETRPFACAIEMLECASCAADRLETPS